MRSFYSSFIWINTEIQFSQFSQGAVWKKSKLGPFNPGFTCGACLFNCNVCHRKKVCWLFLGKNEGLTQVLMYDRIYQQCLYYLHKNHLLDWWWTRLGTDCHLSYYHNEVWKLICYFINNTFLYYFFILEEETCCFILNIFNIFERFQMSWNAFLKFTFGDNIVGGFSIGLRGQ